MTDTAPTRASVRPGFFRWSVVVFAILLPLAVWTAWDYVEARRLKGRIDAIRAKHEAVTLDEIERSRELTGEAAEADRLYQAAAALARPDRGAFARGGFLERADKIMSGSIWPNDVVASWPDDFRADVRAYLERRQDALSLLDRASSLTFEGFSAGTTYSYRTARLWDLRRLCRMRTMLLAIDRESDRAADSLYSGIRLDRAIERSGAWWPVSSFSNEVGFVGDHVRLSPDALSRIARALDAFDRDEALRDRLIRDRALLIGELFVGGNVSRYAGALKLQPGSLWETIRKPWFEHQLNEGLDTFAAAIARSDRPWPERIDAVDQTVRKQGLLSLFYVDSHADRIVDLAQLRCARVAVATEQYKRAYGERVPARLEDLVPAYLDAPPIDPFSGRALRFVMRDGGYIVYSIGSNRRDEGGPQRVVGRTVGPGHADPESLDDIGIRVR